VRDDRDLNDRRFHDRVRDRDGAGRCSVHKDNQPILDHIWTWIQVGGFRADFALGMDHLSAIYALFVTFVGLLIHIFATGYMQGDKGSIAFSRT